MKSMVAVEVEAALLNSEGDPAEEIESAMRAVVRFARLEREMRNDALRRMFDRLLGEPNEEP